MFITVRDINSIVVVDVAEGTRTIITVLSSPLNMIPLCCCKYSDCRGNQFMILSIYIKKECWTLRVRCCLINISCHWSVRFALFSFRLNKDSVKHCNRYLFYVFTCLSCASSLYMVIEICTFRYDVSCWKIDIWICLHKNRVKSCWSIKHQIDYTWLNYLLIAKKIWASVYSAKYFE